jgi:hypothetical protein
MKKLTAIIVIFIYASTLFFTAGAQTTDSPTPNLQTPPNLVLSTIVFVVLVIIVAIMVYAGFKIVKKWSSGQSD